MCRGVTSACAVVAGVFRSEARTALKQKQTALRQAAALKTAIQAAVARQLAAVKTTKSVTDQLSGLLQRGDLLFYATNNASPATIHYVGIYIGASNMVDAPYTGVNVRIDSMYGPGTPIGAVRP